MLTTFSSDDRCKEYILNSRRTTGRTPAPYQHRPPRRLRLERREGQLEDLEQAGRRRGDRQREHGGVGQGQRVRDRGDENLAACGVHLVSSVRHLLREQTVTVSDDPLADLESSDAGAELRYGSGHISAEDDGVFHFEVRSVLHL
jgi:hypothetical protein